MGIGLLASAAGYLKKRWTLSNPPSWLFEVGGGSTSSGVIINETRAFNLSAFWNASRAISGDIASLPLVLYQRESDGGRRRAYERPLYPILHDSIGSITSCM